MLLKRYSLYNLIHKTSRFKVEKDKCRLNVNKCVKVKLQNFQTLSRIEKVLKYERKNNFSKRKPCIK